MAKVLRLVSERIPVRFGLDPMRDVQVLCPTASVGAWLLPDPQRSG